MKAEIISVGTELLLGSILNSNQQYLSKKCAEMGIDLYHLSTVGDNPQRLAAALSDALLRSDLVITTGGLGPTADDITLATIARTLGLPLTRHAATYRAVLKILRNKKRAMTPPIARQADVPCGSVVFTNDFGTAPGILITTATRQHVLLLPGPPRELNPMFERYIQPHVKKITGARKSVLLTESLKFSGIPESDVARRVDDLLRLRPPVTVGIYAKPGEVELKIMAKGMSVESAKSGIASVRRKVLFRFPQEVILIGEETLEEKLGVALRTAKKIVAVAESCTGGLLGHFITNIPGSSNYFAGGITAYSNRIKTAELGIPQSMIDRFGAVSAQVAEAMARGVRKKMGADIGIGITGIAGPGGGSRQKPVGAVYVSIALENESFSRRFHFIGKREDVKTKATKAALVMLIKVVSLKIEGRYPFKKDLYAEICV